MVDQAKHLLDEALQLPEAQRAEMAAVLLRSLEGLEEEGVEQAWSKEIERRLAEIDAGEVEMVPWDQVRSMIFGQAHEPE
ncbi:MAG: addiction module protein [Thermoanaerobaculales bacterium]|nr:addiction module protein [Thermoanaerobaculales bacterium]